MVELFLRQCRYRGDRRSFSRTNLPLLQALDLLWAEPQSNFLYVVLSQSLVLIDLLTFKHLRIDTEMLIRNNNFLVPFIELLLLDGLLFGHHVITRHKDSLEEFTVAESSDTLDFLDKVGLAILFGSVVLLRKHVFGLGCLPVVRDRQLILLRLWGLLRVQVVVLFFVQNIEARFCLPAVLVILLHLLCDFVFVDSWESQGKVVLSIGVEIGIVSGDRLAKLLLLELPNVELL